MIIVVNHSINNPEKFWASAQASLPQLPEGGVKRVIQVLPNNDMTISTCLWEADSIELLDAYLREKVLDWSSETYFELKTDAAMGVSL
ncbi:MAG: hypothetical protein IPK18_07060 [Sphingobacteriales bacterium]|nr:MAG: hypothetical protein IPK18_07060 [Sphingobacteriales bacterium]